MKEVQVQSPRWGKKHFGASLKGFGFLPWGAEEASAQLYPPCKKSQRKDVRARGDRNRDVPPFNGTGREHGCLARLGILENCLLTFTNTVCLREVPTRAELASLLLIINNSSTVKCVLIYPVSFSASPRTSPQKNCKHM